MNAFAALGVGENLTALLKLQGIKMPTPIQQASGKTLAYLLPVIQRVDREKGATQVLIMTPTRELSKQVFDVFRPFALKLGIDGVDIIGGRTIENQLQKLKRDPWWMKRRGKGSSFFSPPPCRKKRCGWPENT